MVLRKLSDQGQKREPDLGDGPLPHRPRLSVSSTLVDGEQSRSVEPTVQMHKLPDNNDIIVSVNPPLKPADESISHVPCDIVLTIDVSGSMMAVPPLPDAQKDSKEQSYLSVLDLTKHATRTIVETLNEKDRLGVVVFTDDVRVIFELSYMTKANKKTVLSRVEELRPRASTNLWHGLKEGLRVLEEASPVPENVQALYLLTDGKPNHMCPRQGYIPKLRQILQEQQAREKKPLPSIHTFGFGNDIRSGLLQAIAELGTGTYSFIPDIGMLGTVFVHSVANLYTTFATQVTLTVSTDDPVEFSSGEGGLQVQEQKSLRDGEFTLNIGSLQYGQSRNILLHYKGKLNLDLEARVTYNFQDSTKSVGSKGLLSPSEESLSLQACEYHRSRARVCGFIRSLFPDLGDSDYVAMKSSDLDGPRADLQNLVQALRNAGYMHEQNMSLIQDLAGEDPQGQAGLAISTAQYYERWGKHYLLSLLNAHSHQICNSFKDPGPLQYGQDSPLFNSCRKELDDCFDNLPAPKPSGTRPGSSGNHAPVAMSRYNRASNPCFAGHCLVRLAGGESIAVRGLRAGTDVWTPRGSRTVQAVVATTVRYLVLCKMGSLSVTPWHPVEGNGGRWAFPCDVAEECVPFTGEIYSVLLAPSSDPDAHAIMVGETVCVTLGHGIVTGSGDGDGDTDNVRAHEFFGDYARVVQSLGTLPVDSEGVLRCSGMRRDAVTGLACGFVGEEGLPRLAREQTQTIQPLPEIAVS